MGQIELTLLRNIQLVQDCFDVDEETSFYMAEALTFEGVS